jgi:hypothetical protein
VRYGNDPGVTFYTHVSDQYAPFYTKLINATVRDATYVLDGLLYHESELQIEEHYTDTAGFTDHVFALCHLLGFRFAPRLRHLGETRLFSVAKPSTYPALEKLIGGTVNTKQINAHWEEILRLAASIQQGTVTASLMLRKLGAYPRQNALAIALRELGKLERTFPARIHPRCRIAPAHPHRVKQRRGPERTGQSGVLQPARGTARPHIGKPATSGQWLKSGRGSNRTLEHGLPGAGYSSAPQPRADDP